MTRSFLCTTLALAMAAGANFAQAKEFEFEFSGAETASNIMGGHGHAYSGDAYCPDGSCYGGHHGKHGKHRKHGKHGYGAHGFAFGCGYPDGIENYGLRPGFCAYAGAGGCRTCSNGNCQYRFYGQPDLFYNYYAWPSCCGLGAELYLSPRPIPPHVGHTFITYQPLMPHEFLYKHHRTYHRYYNGGQGLNRTCVKWYSVPWK